MEASEVQLFQGALMEKFITTPNKKKRRVLLKAIKALDDVLFDVLEAKKGDVYVG
jgi:hypothetical protein